MPNIHLKLHIHIHLNLFKATRRAACNVRGSPSALPSADPQPGAEAPADVRGHPRGLRGPASGTTAILGTRGEGGAVLRPLVRPQEKGSPPSLRARSLKPCRRLGAQVQPRELRAPKKREWRKPGGCRRLCAAAERPRGGRGRKAGDARCCAIKCAGACYDVQKALGVFFGLGPAPRLPSPLCCSLLLPLSGDLRGKIANPQPSPKKPNPRQEKRPRWRRRAGGSARCSPSAGRGDGR